MLFAVAILGAIWRRILGGWTATPRYITIPVGMLFGIPWFIEHPWWYGVIVLVLIPLHYTVAVTFTNPWATALRYSAAMIVLFVMSHCWPILFVGPACASVYYFANKYQWPAIDGKFIDGWTSYGELFVGASGMTAFVASAFWSV